MTARSFAGVYRYSVHNFSDQSQSGTLGIEQSPAQVKLYDDAGLVQTHRPPSATTTAGNTWRVFEIDGDTPSISDDSDTFGYYEAGSSGDVDAFQRAGMAKPLLPSPSFDEPIR
jgi:hypothetical protein